MFSACESTGNFGYPGRITFSRDGGKITCSGDNPFYDAYVTNYDGDVKGSLSAKKIYDTTEVSAVVDDWLTIRCNLYVGTQIKLEAAPNNTGKRRTVYLYGCVDDEDACIKIVQNK